MQNVEKAFASFSEIAKSDVRTFDLEKKLAYLTWVLEKSEPFLFSTSEVDNLNSNLASIADHLPSDANNWAHYPPIEDYFAQIFQIAPYPRIQKIFKSDANAFFEECQIEVAALSANINQEVATLSEGSDAIQDALKEANAKIVSLESALEASDASIKAQFENWETQLDTDTKEKLGELAEKFTDSQTKRREEHEKQLNEIAEALRTAQASTDKTVPVNAKQIADAKKLLEESNDSSIKEAKDVLTEINKIYGVAGNNALSGDFAKTARVEGRVYYALIFIASAFYIAIPASVTYIWMNFIDTNNFQFMDLLARISISAVFLAPAIYFGNLAQRHRRVAIAFRSLGIRIATFDAYLVQFSEAERNEEKKKMTEAFFDAKISDDRNTETSNKDIGKALDHWMGPLEKMAKIITGKND